MPTIAATTKQAKSMWLPVTFILETFIGEYVKLLNNLTLKFSEVKRVNALANKERAS